METNAHGSARYIVTGGAGFIGSHIVDLLLMLNRNVIAIDNLLTGSKANLKNALQHPNFKFYQADVKEVNFLDKVLKRGDIIIHLSATVGVEKVCENSLETLENNYLSTKTVLDLSLKHNCKVFFSSTSEVYGSSLIDMKENDCCQLNVFHEGRSAYTLSKLYCELLCLTYFQQFQLPVIVARFFNTIGPRQSALYGMVVPKFIEDALLGRPITVYGDGQQTRSFCDVSDIAKAIVMLIDCRIAYGQIFNIGNPVDIKIKDLAKFIKEINNSSSEIQFTKMPTERAGNRDIKNRRPSINKLRRYTGWYPERTWQEAVKNANEHYKNQYNSFFCPTTVRSK